MWPFKRLVGCINCGYLINEDYGTKSRCHRNQEIYSVAIEQSNDGKDATGVIGSTSELRLCRFYQKKIEGLTPAGHLEHQLYKGPGVTISKWAILISITATVIALYSANNRPPVYEIERFDYYDGEKAKLEELNKKLSNGNHTILYTRDLNINAPGGLGDKHVVMLGKIKK